MRYKNLAAVVVLGAVAGAVQAQSSVILAGTVDGGVRYMNTGKGSVTTMNSNGFFTSNKLDFIGHEDLGDGMNVHFLLESGFNLGNGQLDNTNSVLFNRGAYVGLGGKFGSVDFGRQYTVAHDITFDYDPFNFEYPGILPLTPATDGTRYNNDIKYTGVFGPLKVKAENSLGGVVGNFADGAAHSIGAQYKIGPVNVGGEYTHRSVAVNTAYFGDNYYILGTALTFGKLRVAGGYMDEDQDAAYPSPNVKTRNFWGGVTYDVTPALRMGAGYYVTSLPNADARRNLGIVSAAYSLSKRTRLYAEADYTRFKGTYITNHTLNATGQPHQMALTVGINHSF